MSLQSGSSIAEIHLGALKDNLFQVRSLIKNQPILAIVKANAYGHGAIRIAQFLTENPDSQVDILGVAFLEEGIALREAGIKTPILVLTGCPVDQIPELIQYQLTPVIFDENTLSGLTQQTEKLGRPISVHLKIDTGMGRLGLLPDQVLAFVDKLKTCKTIKIEGILTHFAEADLADLSFAKTQFNTLQTILTQLEKNGIRIPYCHIANSAAILHFQTAAMNLVRPGLMLYGYSPLIQKTSVPLSPVMHIKTRVISVKKVPKGTPISYGRTFVTNKESRIATVAMGYADGYPMSLSNRGAMIARGKRVPVIGRVCMDMCILDITEVEDLSPGAWVTVLGQEGTESIWADDLAKIGNTHAYEILCGIGSRVQRKYIAPISE